MVRKSTRHRDPIGSTSEAQSRVITRQSLRRHIVEDKSDPQNTDQLVEYNPKLVDVTPTTRIAYAKFMTPKIKKEIRFEDANATFEDEKEKSGILRGRDSLKKLDVTALKERAATIKAASIEQSEKIENVEKDDEKKEEIKISSPAKVEPSTSQTTAEISESSEKRDFRSRTPIEEESSEERSTPDSMLNAERRESKSSLSPQSAQPISRSPTPDVLGTPDLIPESGTSSPTVNIVAPSPVPDADIDEDDPDEEESKVDEPKTSSSLTAPAETIVPGSPALRSDKGKSKITGKILTGWL